MLVNKEDKQAFEDWYGEDDMDDNELTKNICYDAFIAGLEYGRSVLKDSKLQPIEPAPKEEK